MLISIFIIAIISCILLIVLIIQLQKKHQENMLESSKLREKLTKIEQSNPNQFNELSKVLNLVSEEHYRKMLERQKQAMEVLSKQLIQSIQEAESTISNQLKEDLHTYIYFEELQQVEWLQLIHSEQNQRTQLQLFESALNKFPNNRTFFEEYINLLKVTLNEATPQAKKAIIEKMNHVSRIFFDNCYAHDATFAQKTKDEAIRLGHDFMKEQDQEQEEKLTHLINKLDQLVSISNKVKLSDIENLDITINKALLKRYPRLFQKYQQITTKLTTKLMDQPSDEQIKTYNLQAVQAFKKAQDYFNNNEVSVKKGYSLTEIISDLGGWDMQYLSPPAQIYYQNVYSEIFSKLDPSVKPQMTEKMLQTSAKGM